MRRLIGGIAPLIPLGLLIAGVGGGAPLLVDWWFLAATVVAVLQFNPLGALDDLATAETRTVLIAAVVCWVAATIPGWDKLLSGDGTNVIGARLLVAAVGGLLVVVALRQRVARLEAWRDAMEMQEWTESILQGPTVNKILSQLTAQRNANSSHPYNPSEGAEAWSEYGLSETRALIRQDCDDESHRTMTTDKNLMIFSYPVWLLAWNHATLDVERKIAAAVKEAEDRVNAEWESSRDIVHKMAEKEWAEFEAIKKENQAAKDAEKLWREMAAEADMKRKGAEIRWREIAADFDRLMAEQEEAEPQEEAPILELVPAADPLTLLSGAELDAELLRLNNAGEGYDRLANRIGKSKSAVQKAVGRAKARQETA